MAFDDYGNEVPSKADKKTNLLTFGDIGGVGQLVYHHFRFADYALRYEKDTNAEPLAVPVASEAMLPDLNQDDKLDGNTILTSLCNLAMKIDSYETEEQYIDLILQWCKDNMHPYQIDTVFDVLQNADGIDMDVIGHMAAQDGAFLISQFMKDLGNLYYAARLKLALDGVRIADEDTAYDLYQVGRFFEAPTVFEKYKHASVDVPDSVFEGLEEDDLLGHMARESEYEKSHPTEQPGDHEFAREPYDDYEELRDRLIDVFPSFKLRIKADPESDRLTLSADVLSVFDIAWYALAHLIIEEPLRDGSTNPMERSGILAICKHCERFFVRRSKRNIYCSNEECQLARKAKNVRDHRDRRAAEKARADRKDT